MRLRACGMVLDRRRGEEPERLARDPHQIVVSTRSGGGAEQYYADKKYKEAVAVAVEQCAEDTEQPRGVP